MKHSSNYNDKKYRHLTEMESQFLKGHLPKNWPQIIIDRVQENLKSYSRIPSKGQLYALVNGRVKEQEFLPLVFELVRGSVKTKSQIKKKISQIMKSDITNCAARGLQP